MVIKVLVLVENELAGILVEEVVLSEIQCDVLSKDHQNEPQ